MSASFKAPLLTATSAPVLVDVDVTGKQQLKLIVTNGDGRGAGDHADWADARLETTCAASANRLRATAVSAASGEDQLIPLRVYPNPASGRFTLEIVDGYRVSLQVDVVDVHGRAVQTRQADKQQERYEQRVDVSSLPAGVYVLRVKEGERLRTQRLVLQP